MSADLLIRHCSPTLAGIKTGNLFSLMYSSTYEMVSMVSNWNKELTAKGIRILPLKYSNKRALIYVFRPKELEADLLSEDAQSLLTRLGYPCEKVSFCLHELIIRLNKEEEFPHEIGLFLSYPAEDVKGFINNNAQCAKCVGCWKVYGDEVKAKKQFDRYKKCTEIYCKHWAQGCCIARLAVADKENNKIR